MLARQASSRAGLIYGITTYTLWGVFPLYFRAVSDVRPWLILCHRIFWSAIFLVAVVSIRREWRAVWPVLRNPRNVRLLSAGALLIAANWLIFIYSVGSHQVLESSLGYFINPLLSIALGVIFLGERLRLMQWLAVVIATVAVANLTLHGNAFPWIAISLACTFGLYGLVRKKLNINSLHGLLVETSILFPIARALLVAPLHVESPPRSVAILSLSGVITAVPLLMFGAALRRLRLSTMGFLQYIGPTLQFLIALVLFHEPLQKAKLASFALCWFGIGVYAADSLLNRSPQPVADEPE